MCTAQTKTAFTIRRGQGLFGNISINLRQLVGQVVGACDNYTARTGSHIPSPCQAGEADVAQGPDPTLRRLSTHGLGGIFNNRNPEWHCDRFGPSDIRCLAQQMWTDNAERLVVDNPLKITQRYRATCSVPAVHNADPMTPMEFRGCGGTHRRTLQPPRPEAPARVRARCPRSPPSSRPPRSTSGLPRWAD